MSFEVFLFPIFFLLYLMIFLFCLMVFPLRRLVSIYISMLLMYTAKQCCRQAPLRVSSTALSGTFSGNTGKVLSELGCTAGLTHVGNIVIIYFCSEVFTPKSKQIKNVL